jgi:ubiquinone/menaquinone biosynthesis C-methylase UbiE
MNVELATPDFAAIKARQQAVWASGDYAVIGTTLQIVGENLCEAVDLRAGETVLDVAAGNGNATLAAARRFGRVTSTDYVAALLDRGRQRAAAEGAEVAFREADAEALPFPDASFDVVLSSFGVMFTPDQETAAREMARVLKPGGRIGLANWTPDGFIGQLFKVIGRHVPPPSGVKPPALWGTEARLRELFPGHRVSATPRQFQFRYRSPEHWLEVFRNWYGPTHRAFAGLDAQGQAALAAEILDLLHRSNRGGSTLVVPSDYVDAVIRRA